MKLFLPLLAATVLSPSIASAKETKPQKVHQSTATIQIHNTAPYGIDTRLPSDLFLPNQIAILSAPATGKK
jgi:hypothetical protein